MAKVLDVSSGDQVKVVKDPRGATKIFDIDVSPDGTLLVAGRAEGTELQLYGLPSGEQLDVVRAAHGVGILDVEFSGDGRLVATGGVDATAKVWEGVERGRLHPALTLRTGAAAGSVSLDRMGSRFFTWGTPLRRGKRLGRLASSRGEILTLPGPQTRTCTPTSRSRPTDAGSSRPPAPRGRCGFGAPTRKAALRPRAAASERWAVVGIDVSPDGARIATAGADGSARIFAAETGKQLLVVPPVSTAFRDVCAGSTGRSSARTARGSRRPGLTTPFASSTRAPAVSSARSASPSGTASARTRSSGARTEVGSWRWRPAERSSGMRAPSGSSLPCRELEPPQPRRSGAPTAGRCSSEAGAGRLVYDASSGELLRTLDTIPGVSELAFSRDGARLAVGTVFLEGYVNRIVGLAHTRGRRASDAARRWPEGSRGVPTGSFSPARAGDRSTVRARLGAR